MGNFECPLSNKPITIGYYPIRGKAQIIRLLCEYLHISYKDLLLSPDEWQKYKQGQARDWIVKDMPFIIDDTFSVTGVSGCIYYIVEKSKRTDLLGKNAEDFIKISSMKNKKDVLHCLLGLYCNARSCDPMEETQKRNSCWKQKMEPLVTKLEHQAKPEGFYLGYLSVMDFFLYEAVSLMECTFPQKMPKFSKLRAIKERVSKIPQILNYEKSCKCHLQRCPVKYFNKYKMEMSQQEGNTRGSSNGSNQMDVE